MRVTLEELKAMSTTQLGKMWYDGVFPFDRADCGHCLTVHFDLGDCKIPEHQPLITHGIGIGAYRQRLEELYALRLFHDALYPAEQEAPSQEKAPPVLQSAICTPARNHPLAAVPRR